MNQMYMNDPITTVDFIGWFLFMLHKQRAGFIMLFLDAPIGQIKL